MCQECTFRPDIARSQQSYRSGFLPSPGGHGISSSSNSPRPLEKDEFVSFPDLDLNVKRSYRNSKYHQSEETFNLPFRPRVNEVSPSMLAAQTYLKENVFQRLSQPLPEVILQDGESVLVPPSVQEKHRRLENAELQEAEEQTREKAEKYRQFLLRQNRAQEDREINLEELERKYRESFQPTLNEKSRKLVEKRISLGSGHRSIRERYQMSGGLKETYCAHSIIHFMIVKLP